MNDFEKKLKFHMECIVEITDKIDNRQEYMEELKKYLPYMNQVIPEILKKSEDPQIEFELNDEFVLQVLQDILYCIENEDSVFLQDVLQNGLMEIYKYTLSELEDGNIYE